MNREPDDNRASLPELLDEPRRSILPVVVALALVVLLAAIFSSFVR